MNHETVNFLALIQGFRRGDLVAEGDLKLNELMTAVAATGEGGNLTLALAVKLNKAGQVEITPAIKMKKPERALGVGIFYLGDDGRLSRRDPNQMDIEDEIARRREIMA